MPADLIIIGAIAAFVLLRLRSVLGHKIGHDEPPASLKDVTPQPAERIVQIFPKPQDAGKQAEPSEEAAREPEEVWDEATTAGIQQIRAVEPGFSMRDFLEGAKTAFEMIFTAFNKNDQDALKSLLSKDIFKHFKQELDAFAKQEEHEESTLISILSAQPTAIEVKGGKASVTVTFESEQIGSTRDKKGKTVPGTTGAIHTVEDVWSFERILHSSNPNWTIVAT